MDIISFNEGSTANGRIENFIKNPDSTSGVVTVPSTIASGETITIPAGRTAILPDVQIDGTLNVQGKVFIPTGTTTSKVIPRVTSTDNAVVRFDGVTGDVQNSSVIIYDNGNVGIGVATSSSEINVDSVSAKEYAGISLFNTKYINSTSYVDAGKSTGIRDSSIFFIHNIDNSSNIAFQTQDSGDNTDRRVERFRIGSTGDIGIGMISTGNKVAIKQRIDSSDGGISIKNANESATAVISILNTGQLILRNNAINTLSIYNGNTLHISPNGALGYGAGSGISVVQPSTIGKETSVTANKPSGQITMNNAALAAGGQVGFAINNSILSSTDGIIITHNDKGLYIGANYDIKVVYSTNGLFIVVVKNVSTGSLSDTVTFRFDIIKGAIA